MANRESLSSFSNPFERYIFHFLPGLPVFVGICIILQKSLNLCILDLPTQAGTLVCILSLILLLVFIFLFGMLVDSIRHLIEEMFLVPKWSEYKIVRKIVCSKSGWNIYEKVRETEYYYLEFFGNVAISLAFLWGVMIHTIPERLFLDSNNHFGSYILLIHLVFLVRPFLAPAFWKWCEKAEDWHNSDEIGFISFIKWLLLNVFCFRSFDFLATFSLIILFTIKKDMSSYFYFIGIITITASFEVYIVRFKRYKEFLKKI